MIVILRTGPQIARFGDQNARRSLRASMYSRSCHDVIDTTTGCSREMPRDKGVGLASTFRNIVMMLMDCPSPCPASTGWSSFDGPPHPLLMRVAPALQNPSIMVWIRRASFKDILEKDSLYIIYSKNFKQQRQSSPKAHKPGLARVIADSWRTRMTKGGRAWRALGVPVRTRRISATRAPLSVSSTPAGGAP